jgi:hypothetical protein
MRMQSIVIYASNLIVKSRTSGSDAETEKHTSIYKIGILNWRVNDKEYFSTLEF